MRRIRLARFLMRALNTVPKRFPITYTGLPAQPVFIFGSGRNGSTLINRILNRHAELFAPTEQYFLGPSIIKFHLYNHLITWRDMVKVVAGELETEAHTWDMNTSNIQNQLFNSKNQSLQYLMDTLYRAYLYQQKPEANRWVDTTPPNIHYYKEIFTTFPKANYIFLVRDGRDVVSSYVSGGAQHFGRLADPEQAAQLWNQSTKAYNWLKKQTTVSLIRYEELVEQPRQVISGLCEQLHIQFDMKLFDYYKDPLYKGHQDSYFENAAQPIFNLSVGNWEHDLDPEILTRILPMMERNLKYWKYL